MPRKFGFQISTHHQTWQSKQDNPTNKGPRIQIRRSAGYPVEPQDHHNQGSSMQIMRPSASGSHPAQHQYCEIREMIMDNHGMHHQNERLKGQLKPRWPQHGHGGSTSQASRTHGMLNGASRAASEAISHQPRAKPTVVTVEEVTYQYWRGQ